MLFRSDFVKLAEAYGIKGYAVNSQEDFTEAFRDALAAKRPALLNCYVGIDEKVLPMVAPGAAINELIIE